MTETFDVPLTTAPIMTRLNTRTILDLDPGLGRTMGAAFDDAMVHNPVQAVNRMISQNIYGGYTEGHTGVGSDLAPIRPSRLDAQTQNQARTEFFQRMESNPNWLNKQSAEQLIKDSGFTTAQIKISSGGANSFALESVIRGKVAERERELILQRGSEGRMMPILAAGLGASILDPINIAASFIPVVGQEKYAALLRGTSSTGARFATRAGVGVIEGAVGAVIVEPLSLMAARQDLLHYGIEDSMMNVLFGSAIGGGMHTGIGYIGDKIRLRNGLSLDPEPRGATAQALNEVDPVLRQKAMESAIMAAVRDRGLVVDELIDGIHGPLNVGEKFELPKALQFDLDDTGAVIPRKAGDLEKAFDEILAAADTPVAVRRIIEASDTAQEAVQTLSRLAERQDILSKQNIEDVKKILGSGATKGDIEIFSKAVTGQFQEFADEIRGIASRQPAGVEFDLKNYSEIFESPNNLNTFSEARLAEVNEIRERVPTDMDDVFVETQIKDSEAIIKEFEQATGIEDAAFRAESEKIKKLSQEQGRMTNNLLNCMLGAG